VPSTGVGSWRARRSVSPDHCVRPRSDRTHITTAPVPSNPTSTAVKGLRPAGSIGGAPSVRTGVDPVRWTPEHLGVLPLDGSRCER